MGKKGFEILPPEQLREVASKGGKAAHASGNAHKWTPEQAREAGKKGAAARLRKMREG